MAGRLTVAVGSAWAVLAVGTAIAYLLPLSQHLTDLASNVSFGISGLIIMGTLARAVVVVSGVDRIAWSMLFVSLVVLLVLFALDPASSNGPPTAALAVAPMVGLSLVAMVLVFGRRGIDRLDLARVAIDGVWLTIGLVAASWHWAFAPLVQLRGSNLWAASFPAMIALSSASTLILFPRVAGRVRLSYAALGLGTAVTALAGVIHIQLAHAGTLRFGTWYDYLWVIGLSLLGLSTLQPDMGSTLRARRPSARSEQIITCLPVAGLAIPIVDGDAWESTPSALTIVMIVVLALRLVVLISQNQILGDRLTSLAHHDELTGLLNRRALLDRLEEWTQTMAAGRSFAVLYLDLDGFKSVNDVWGHAAGDHVLAVTAERLRSAARPGDVVARLGGDEFVVLAADADGAALGERLVRLVAQPITWATHQLSVGCSVGVAAAGSAITSDLLACADAALYRSKAEGRNRVSVATPSPSVSSVH